MERKYQARIGVGILMLLLAFIGVILSYTSSSGGWEYWRAIVPLYAASALWLSWYIRRTKETVSPITLWHEFLHWVGLLGTTFLVSLFVHSGILSRTLGGLFILSLLSLAVFLAGIYIESTFLLIGLILAVLAGLIAYAIKYLVGLVILLLLLGATTLVIVVRRSHKTGS